VQLPIAPGPRRTELCSGKYQPFDDLRKTESVSQQLVDDLKNQLQNAESAYQIARKQYESLAARRSQVQAQLKSIGKKIKDARSCLWPELSPTSIMKKVKAIPPLAPIAEVINLDEGSGFKILSLGKDAPGLKPARRRK